MSKHGKGPGRPPTKELDRLRTIVWFRAVRHASGIQSPYGLEQRMEPNTSPPGADRVSRRSKWYGYENGDKKPVPMSGKVYAVEAAETAYPGTRRFFDSPLWRVLAKERLTQVECDRELARLHPDVVRHVLGVPDASGTFKPRDFTVADAEALALIRDFDALTAVALLVAKAEAISSPELREVALIAYQELQPTLEQLPELSEAAGDLFMACDTAFKHWLYISNQSRLDIVFFSESMRADAPASGQVYGKRRLGTFGETTPKTSADVSPDEAPGTSD